MNKNRQKSSMPSVSITDVAKLAGVSIATVSRCINDPERVREKTRKKVQKVIKETSFSINTLAANFRRGKTNMIMVVVPSIGDPFFTNVIHGLRRAAKEKGYSLVINEGKLNNMSVDEINTLMVSRQVDGIILLASMSPFGNEVISSHTHRSLPIVIGCEAITKDLEDLPSVHIDNILAAKQATDYLISQKHKRIAFIAGEKTSLLTRDRELGYRQALEKAGYEVKESLIVSGELTISGARVATRTLLSLDNPPTAIFCANDEMAIGAIHQVKAAGLKIPEDISIMGFDNTRYAEVTDPPLTTVGQPAEEIGARTLYRMVKAIEKGLMQASKPEIVPHELVIRSSVGPAKI